MTFKLEEKESFNESFQRIVAEQLDQAISSLSADAEDVDKSVHDARVCIKKIRALLRLVRPSLGKEVFENANKSFRDIGRLLSSARKRGAMLEVVDLLNDHESDSETKELLQTVSRIISESRKCDDEKQAVAIAEAQAELEKLKASINDWPKVSGDLSFEKGLRRVFKDGRTSFARAYEAYTVDAFHEWRKHVKDFLYQSRILRPIWSRYMKVLRGDLKTIADLLSQDHDLALFRKMVSEMELPEAERKSVDDLFRLIDSRRVEVEGEARTLGNRIYAEKPRAFARRMHAYWTEWHELK